MSKNYIIRPKGIMFIFGQFIIYIIWLGLILLCITFYKCIYLFIPFMALLFFIFILQTRELYLYKLIITNEQIKIRANRELFFVRHSATYINYEDLISIQSIVGFQGFWTTLIALYYKNEQYNYLDLSRFSKKQTKHIMLLIKEIAEKYNSYEIEIKSDKIQKF